MGAPSRPIWTAVGLDPISSGLATHNNSCSSDNNLLFRVRVATAAVSSKNDLIYQKLALIYCQTKFYLPKFKQQLEEMPRCLSRTLLYQEIFLMVKSMVPFVVWFSNWNMYLSHQTKRRILSFKNSMKSYFQSFAINLSLGFIAELAF